MEVPGKVHRLDLQRALSKFNGLQQGALFDEEDEEAVNSIRKQACGIRMMMGRVNKKKHNLKDGSRTTDTWKPLLLYPPSEDSPRPLTDGQSSDSILEACGSKSRSLEVLVAN